MSSAKRQISDIKTVEVTVGVLKFLDTLAAYAAQRTESVESFLAHAAHNGQDPWSEANAEARADALNAYDLVQRIREGIDQILSVVEP